MKFSELLVPLPSVPPPRFIYGSTERNVEGELYNSPKSSAGLDTCLWLLFIAQKMSSTQISLFWPLIAIEHGKETLAFGNHFTELLNPSKLQSHNHNWKILSESI